MDIYNILLLYILYIYKTKKLCICSICICVSKTNCEKKFICLRIFSFYKLRFKQYRWFVVTMFLLVPFSHCYSFKFICFLGYSKRC